MEQKQIIIEKLQKHVSNAFGLGADYVITNFNAKKMAITLANNNYEVTVIVKGAEAEKLSFEVAEEMAKISEILEQAE